MTVTSISGGATASYRGYRLQALYTLHRLLCDTTAPLIYHPEGKEDLAIYDLDGNLLEVIQVKSHADALTLSELGTSGGDSFFYRVAEEMRIAPNATAYLVTYGPVGPELRRALDGDETDLARITSKLDRLSTDEVQAVLSKTQLEEVNEPDLVAKIYQRLRDMFTGIDAGSAFDALVKLLYDCAEHKRTITPSDVVAHITTIGKFFAACVAKHQEWFISIIPVEDRIPDERERIRLAGEFHAGVNARYEHVLADLDVRRPHKIQEISEAFKQHSVVILRGASGQGKSTLALRYIYDHFPNRWRFAVIAVADRHHALRAAAALVSHTEAIGIPVCVYLDVSPEDTGWKELVRQLGNQANLQILVSIREEDFRRANISQAEAQFTPVDLSLEEDEARQIYDSLIARNLPPRFTSFDDAWTRFGRNGPLLEFAYLVTEGEMLLDRLRQQVNNLRSEIAAGRRPIADLQLIRAVAVASSYGARLQCRPLSKQLQLVDPMRSFELLENEYLLRRVSDGHLVDGLHPIRSAVLSELLTDAVFEPWIDVAVSCMELMEEQDVGTFLLFAFSLRQQDTAALLTRLDRFHPQSWSAIASVLKALLWYGARMYILKNETLIRELQREVGAGWWLLLDCDVADITDGHRANWWKDVEWIPESRRTLAAAATARQTDLREAWLPAQTWLSCRETAPEPPVDEEDWSNLGLVAYWMGRFDLTFPFATWAPRRNLDAAVETLALAALGDAIYGLRAAANGDFSAWFSAVRDHVANRFRQETNTFVLEDDGAILTAHFVLAFDSANSGATDQAIGNGSKDMLHEAAMNLLNLLFRLLPNRTTYGCQAYGQRLWGGDYPFDSTLKRIEHSGLHTEWTTSYNGVFLALGNQLLRSGVWDEYAKGVVELRKLVVGSLAQLLHAIESHFLKRGSTNLFSGSRILKDWQSCSSAIANPPLLPRVAVDEWGFDDKVDTRNVSRPKGNERDEYGPAPARYERYERSFREYTRCLSNFLNQAPKAALREPDDRFRRLSLVNLAEAVNALSGFHSEFRGLLEPYVSQEVVTALEKQERRIIPNLLTRWQAYVFPPNRRSSPPSSFKHASEKAVNETKTRMLRFLSSGSTRETRFAYLPNLHEWEGVQSLWLMVDTDYMVDLPYEAVTAAVRAAIPKADAETLFYHLINLNCPQMMVVPLVKGRSISRTAWSLNFWVFVSDELPGWWNFIPKAIPDADVRRLGLRKWDDQHISRALQYYLHFAAIGTLLTHLKDLDRLPKLDVTGETMCRAYIERAKPLLANVLGGYIAAQQELMTAFNQLSNDDEESKRGQLLEAVRIHFEIQRAIWGNSESGGTPVNQASVDTLTTLMAHTELLQSKAVQAHKVTMSWVNYLLPSNPID